MCEKSGSGKTRKSMHEEERILIQITEILAQEKLITPFEKIKILQLIKGVNKIE